MKKSSENIYPDLIKAFPVILPFMRPEPKPAIYIKEAPAMKD